MLVMVRVPQNRELGTIKFENDVQKFKNVNVMLQGFKKSLKLFAHSV